MSIKVSVIIPNYNHASYLEKRIESVLNQSYRNFHIILMDDCSTDNSLEIIERYRHHPQVEILLNESNSGNTFIQWNRGVLLSQGDYIWIAESDDYANERFLEALVSKLDSDSTLGLAYCQSWKINAKDEIIDNMTHWTQDISRGRWEEDFIGDGKEECSNYLIYKNTIPNASAVLFRKDVYIKAGLANESMKLSGDYLCWVNMLLISNIAYCANHLNYFRTHSSNVRSKFSKNGVWLSEESQVRSHIFRHTVSPFFVSSIKKFIHYWVICIFRDNIPSKVHLDVYKTLITNKGQKWIITQILFFKIIRLLTPRTVSEFKILLGDYLFPSLKAKLKNSVNILQ